MKGGVFYCNFSQNLQDYKFKLANSLLRCKTVQ